MNSMEATDMRAVISALVALLCAVSLSALELTPSPKVLKQSSDLAQLSYSWKIEKGGGRAEEWLRQELAGKNGWQVGDEATSAIHFRKLSDAENPELYELEVADGKIVLSAASESGFLRAAGRFLALLRNPEVQYGADTFRIPALKIRDWPDYPVRVMDLTMAFWEPFSDAERLDSTKRIVRILAEHGFNYVVIELGGNYESDHFKSNRPTPWSKKDIRELVRFCNLRGITAIPGINTIGHLGRAPQICVLKNAAGKDIGHDIRKPEFYTEYAAVLDELMKLFGNPPYCRVGGDEASEVFQSFGLTPEENARLFAKVFNFAAEHLEKYNSRAIIWHDMLFSEELGGKRIGNGFSETQAGRVSSPALKHLSRKLILNYWNYGKYKKYEGIDILQAAGFEIWASTWNIPEAIPALAKYAHDRKAVGYDGTTWCNNHTKGGAMILVAECAWNANSPRTAIDPDEIFLREWNDIPFFPKAKTASSPAFNGGTEVTVRQTEKIRVGNLELDPSRPLAGTKTELVVLRNPEDVVKRLKKHPETQFFMHGGERFVMPIPIINGFRKWNSFALYTPSHGKTTGQNKWGEDWIIKNSRVVKHSEYVPDLPIPPDGGIISANTTGADVHNNIRKILAAGKVELIAARGVGENVPLKATCKDNIDTVVLVFSALLCPYSEKMEAAANVKINTVNGTSENYILRNDFAIAPNPHFTGNFKTFFLAGGMVAVIWKSDKGIQAAGIDVEFTPFGVAMGTTLVAAAEME